MPLDALSVAALEQMVYTVLITTIFQSAALCVFISVYFLLSCLCWFLPVGAINYWLPLLSVSPTPDWQILILRE